MGRSIVLFLIFWLPFVSRQKVTERRVGSSPLIIKGENSQKAAYVNFMSWVVGDFFQTQKAEMTMIVGKTFRLVLPILRRVERGAEKNPE